MTERDRNAETAADKVTDAAGVAEQALEASRLKAAEFVIDTARLQAARVVDRSMDRLEQGRQDNADNIRANDLSIKANVVTMKLLEAGRRDNADNIDAVNVSILANAENIRNLEAFVVPRISKVQWRLNVLAIFSIAMLMILAGALQYKLSSVSELVSSNRAFITAQCEMRITNAKKSTAYYDGMIKIEQGNKFIDDALRAQRIKLFTEAKPIIPTC